jgi:hypothetical protein
MNGEASKWRQFARTTRKTDDDDDDEPTSTSTSTSKRASGQVGAKRIPASGQGLETA